MSARDTCKILSVRQNKQHCEDVPTLIVNTLSLPHRDYFQCENLSKVADNISVPQEDTCENSHGRENKQYFETYKGQDAAAQTEDTFNIGKSNPIHTSKAQGITNDMVTRYWAL